MQIDSKRVPNYQILVANDLLYTVRECIQHLFKMYRRFFLIYWVKDASWGILGVQKHWYMGFLSVVL